MLTATQFAPLAFSPRDPIVKSLMETIRRDLPDSSGIIKSCMESSVELGSGSGASTGGTFAAVGLLSVRGVDEAPGVSFQQS